MGWISRLSNTLSKKDMTLWWTPTWVDRQLGALEMPTRRQFWQRVKCFRQGQRWATLATVAWFVTTGILWLSFQENTLRALTDNMIFTALRNNGFHVKKSLTVVGCIWVFLGGVVFYSLLSCVHICRNRLRCITCGSLLSLDNHENSRECMRTNQCQTCKQNVFVLDQNDREILMYQDIPSLKSLEAKQKLVRLSIQSVIFGFVVLLIPLMLWFSYSLIWRGLIVLVFFAVFVVVMISQLRVRVTHCWHCRGGLYFKELDENCPNCGMPLSREAADKVISTLNDA